LGGGEGEVEREEAVIAAAAAGVPHHHNAQELGPALGYHKASMVWYQSLTGFP